MSVIKAKKYSYTALGLALFSFLLLTLSGCDTTSDPKVSYQATGSWQGTIGADQVRGIIAPDGSYHLAIVDAAGDSVGEYVGAIDTINPDNIGSMSRTRLQAGVSSGPLSQATFILSADQLKSDQGIVLTRTVEANGPALQEDVAGYWSVFLTDTIADVVITENGEFSGDVDGNCRYSGTLNLIEPAWNIYSLKLITSLTCPQGAVTFSGLAMKLRNEDSTPHLWLAANSLAKTFLAEWGRTDDYLPIAAIAIQGEQNGKVLVKDNQSSMRPLAVVSLDAKESTHINSDQLTYQWSVSGPGLSEPLVIFGKTVTFAPLEEGSYNITLTVNDGLLSGSSNRPVTVKWTDYLFYDCNNGTVLDTRGALLWLKDAACNELNVDLLTNSPIWGAGVVAADSRVTTLAAPNCSLGDSSLSGDWRLPTANEFEVIVDRSPTYTTDKKAPALLNGKGESKWSEGNVFTRVGTDENTNPLF